MDDTLFQDPKASELEQLREKARINSHLITYDCYNAIVDGERVKCKKGYLLAGGTMPLLTVLRGRTASVCHTCKDFDGD